jgi:plasmid replication initiation protein
MGFSVTDVGYKADVPDRAIKKHTATIHCSNTLSLLQRKISNALLYHAYPELMLKEEHAINIKHLCRLIGYQGNNHAAIKVALKGLISTVIEWNVMQDDMAGENWTASAIIASVSLEGATCYYAYSPRMKQLLHSPSLFGKIDLVIQSQFRSSYGLALYENCVRYRGLPQTKWFDLPVFKKLMGVPEEHYPVFRDFKRRVLDKAINEVNAYADLKITSEYGRVGRQIVKVRFKLSEGQGAVVGQAQEEKTSRLAMLKKKLGIFGLSKKQIHHLMKHYTPPYIEEKIAIIESSKQYQARQVRNHAGLLLSALKDDYQKRSLDRDQPSKEQSVWPDEYRALEKGMTSIHQQYLFYREERITQAIDALREDERMALMQAFESHAAEVIHGVLRVQGHKYSRENILQSPPVSALFRQFALNQLNIPLIDIEQFVQGLPDALRFAWEQLKIKEN